MIRAGVDVQVRRSYVGQLRHYGITVVASAGPYEPDEVWFARALAARAQVIISPDHDLGELCAKHGLLWVQLPGNSDHTLEELVDWTECVLGYGIVEAEIEAVRRALSEPRSLRWGQPMWWIGGRIKQPIRVVRTVLARMGDEVEETLAEDRSGAKLWRLRREVKSYG